jgi:hypothetical protein
MSNISLAAPESVNYLGNRVGAAPGRPCIRECDARLLAADLKHVGCGAELPAVVVIAAMACIRALSHTKVLGGSQSAKH